MRDKRKKSALNEYLMREGLKKYKFAEKCGISVRTISAVCNGYKVRPGMAKAIEIFTNGHVKAKEVCRTPEKL